nr:MAG TPA: minor capsid protein [Caudoviricetes sp.]DAO87696.1 MAG TPA: minor capsid protein [Caudoviricetes sp.]
MRAYPFDPSTLDALPEDLAELFRALEITLLEGICSQLKEADELNEATVQSIRALRSHGINLNEIKKAIRRTSGISETKLNKLLDDVVERNQKYYTNLIDLAHITQPETLVDAAEVAAIRAQTLDTFHNLTASMGFLVDAGRTMLPPAKAYQWALDSAVLQVQSGAINYNQAIKTAVKELADSGLKVVDYESGHRDQVDVAVRRAVMTGVSQICAKYTEQSAEYLDTPYFEVSAHIGARDKPGPSPWSSHKDWQGRVYSIHAGDIYPSIYEVCGLGAVDGLEGANCRHRRFPFVEGVSERTYTDGQLEHIDDGHGCTFDGKEYTAYEATQIQRRIERTVRKLKREKAAYNAAGLHEDETAVNIRLRRLNAKYKAFSAEAGLPEQPERMKVLYQDNAVSKTASSTETSIPKNREFYTEETGKWRETATPNSHVVRDLQEHTVNGITYKVDGHNVVLDYSPHEKEIAELIEKEFGGEIYMVPRVNSPQGVSTPDYLFRGIGYDLKTLGESAGANTLFNRVKKAKWQAQNFIIDVTNTKLDEDTILAQVKKVFHREDTKWVDEILIVQNGSRILVFKRK